MQIPTIGTKINRLTLISYEPSRKGHRMAKWKCECGKDVVVRISAVLVKNTLSCGCLNRELAYALVQSFRTHGCTGTSEYSSWQKMRSRCFRDCLVHTRENVDGPLATRQDRVKWPKAFQSRACGLRIFQRPLGLEWGLL